MQRKYYLGIVLLMAALALCAVQTPALAGVEVFDGRTGPGSLYAFFVPDGLDGDPWNGDLVVYCHGYWHPDAPVHLPAGVDGLRDALLSLGYGVAWSSYPENGYALKEGFQRTHQLRGLFASRFGQPRRTYVMGHSLGGIISLMLAEKFPGHYDGALPMCGLLGGTRMQVEYVYNSRVLFDYFFPGVLPGDAMNVPEGLDFDTEVYPLVMDALVGNPPAAMEMAGVDQIELPWTSFPKLIESVLSVLWFQTQGTNDFLDRTHGHLCLDNTATVYTGCSDDPALNAGVDRFAARPDALNFMDHYYQPHGNLKVPVLTLHTTQDPVVHFRHEAAYATIVAEAGASDMLVQQHVDRYGHCTMSPMETFYAFLALVNWVETGVAPPGGDVTIP